MGCYHPIPAATTAGGDVTLWPQLGTEDMHLPCGKCLGCKEHHAILWARRSEHQASQHRYNSFLTLTYDDEHLPYRSYLEPEDLQKFFKRLRKNANSRRSTLNSDRGSPLRYLACGEYGETNGRPHYHAALFNCGFSDAKPCGTDLFQSATLTKIWGLGQVKFGDFNAGAAGYIAKYTIKKQAGLYTVDEDGVVRPNPFLRVSKGLGMEWLARYSEDMQHGYITDKRGKKRPIPRAYLKKLQDWSDQQLGPAPQRNPLLDAIDHARYNAGLNQGDKNTPERLRDAEIIHQQKKERQTRKL